MKGDKTIKILEIIEGGIVVTGAIIATVATSPYGSSVSKISRKIEKNLAGLESLDDNKKRQSYYSMLTALKKDGLINKEKDSFFITKKGKEKLHKLREKNSLSLPSPAYRKTENSGRIVIVVFDIPEKERRKRAWIRSALINMGLSLVQRSVWIGKTKIPEEFIEDLGRLRIVNYVEIFEITKTGSLKNII